MEGDTNLIERIKDEKDYGLVERLSLAADLTNEDVDLHLKQVTSDEARQENKERIKRFVAIMIKFGNQLCRDKKKPYNAHHSSVAQLNNDLLNERKQYPVNFGLVFDPEILKQIAAWFNNNEYRFGETNSYVSRLFWINFGKFQLELSARDQQALLFGIDKLNYSTIQNMAIDAMPKQTLINPNGSCYFDRSTTQLGIEFNLEPWGKIGYGGYSQIFTGDDRGDYSYYKRYVETKKRLCNAKYHPKKSLIERLTSYHR